MFFQCLARLARNRACRRLPRGIARRDRDIDRRQIVLVQTEGFSRQAFDEVARDGVAAASGSRSQALGADGFRGWRVRTR